MPGHFKQRSGSCRLPTPSHASELRAALAEQLRGKIAFDQRRSSEAAELLLSAAQRIEPFAPRAARDMHLEALAAAVWAGGPGDRELAVKAAQAARATSWAENPPRTADLVLDAIATRVTEGYAAAAPALAAALDAIRDYGLGSDDADDLLWLTGNRLAGLIATEAWDYEAGLALAKRQVRVARESGALVQLQFALNFLANHVIVSGDLRGASALLEEERLLSTMTLVTPNRTMLIDALRGDTGRTVPLVQAMIETGKERSRPGHFLRPLCGRCSVQRARASRGRAGSREASDRVGRAGLSDTRRRRTRRSGLQGGRHRLAVVYVHLDASPRCGDSHRVGARNVCPDPSTRC